MVNFLPILLQVGIVLGFGISTLLISVILGKSAKRNATKDTAYECGMVAKTGAQPRFSVKFYLIAMLFILFDIEVVFLYPWAVNYKELLHTYGTSILWSMVGFLSIITVGYVYVVKKGVLDWKNG